MTHDDDDVDLVDTLIRELKEREERENLRQEKERKSTELDSSSTLPFDTINQWQITGNQYEGDTPVTPAHKNHADEDFDNEEARDIYIKLLAHSVTVEDNTALVKDLKREQVVVKRLLYFLDFLCNEMIFKIQVCNELSINIY